MSATSTSATALRGAPTIACEQNSNAPRRACPECGGDVPRGARKLFCSPAHKAAYSNRMTVRGRILTPLAMADRITRSDIATGKLAGHEYRTLIAQWIAEDRAAGRFTAVEYLAARRRLGFGER